MTIEAQPIRKRLMREFADAIIAVAPVATRKSKNRFFRDCDRWTNRLLNLDLIDLTQRQDLRRHIAEAYLAKLM
jgi:hypothetical protein